MSKEDQRQQGQLPPSEPQFDISIIENPAKRLQNVIDKAGYTGVDEFIVKGLDVFEASLAANGKAVVEDEKANLRYIFNIKRRSGIIDTLKKPLRIFKRGK
jgi:hypothetical protein